MENKTRKIAELIASYILWGFQPLYWKLLAGYQPFLLLSVRIIFSALFSCILLFSKGELNKIYEIFNNKHLMRKIIPATIFVFLDWAVYIWAVDKGRIMDCSIGYYINPLLIFAGGVIIYKEKITKSVIVALLIAIAGIIVSIAAFGDFPILVLIIAFNWAVYALIKKDVNLSGVQSIAVESLIMVPFAVIYIVLTKNTGVLNTDSMNKFLLVFSGVVTALPMYLYSGCVNSLPVTVMVFAQYLSPTLGLISGLISGEKFTPSKLISLIFFLFAIVIFSCGELRKQKEEY